MTAQNDRSARNLLSSIGGGRRASCLWIITISLHFRTDCTGLAFPSRLALKCGRRICGKACIGRHVSQPPPAQCESQPPRQASRGQSDPGQAGRVEFGGVSCCCARPPPFDAVHLSNGREPGASTGAAAFRIPAMASKRKTKVAEPAPSPGSDILGLTSWPRRPGPPSPFCAELSCGTTGLAAEALG